MMNAHADSRLPSGKAGDAASGLGTGISRFMFREWAGPELRVWTYVPSSVGADAPILFVLHGVERDAKRYIEDWARTAEQHGVILVAPEFDERRFPGSDYYNLGGVIDPGSGKRRDPETWSFSVIEPLFSEVKRRSGSRAATYSIYGHSAGAQFVHRFVMMTKPAHLDQAVAANAGWYTWFDPERSYPQGIRLGRQDRDLDEADFSQRLTILLGTEDLESEDRHLRDDAWARGQGKNRFERGRAFFAHAQDIAGRAAPAFRWRLRYAPGVGHENRKMAAFAADILFRARQANGQPAVLLAVRRIEEGDECEPALISPDNFHGLAAGGCASLGDYRLDTWASRQGVLQSSANAVLLDQPLGRAGGPERRPPAAQNIQIALVDAGGKDPKESSALQRRLDAVAESGADLVLLLNSPTEGRVRTSGQYALFHLPGSRASRRGRETSLLVSVTPDSAAGKIRLSVYPANGTGDWKAFADAVRRIVLRTRERIRFEAGQDEQGDYVAFEIDWPRGG